MLSASFVVLRRRLGMFLALSAVPDAVLLLVTVAMIAGLVLTGASLAGYFPARTTAVPWSLLGVWLALALLASVLVGFAEPPQDSYT